VLQWARETNFHWRKAGSVFHGRTVDARKIEEKHGLYPDEFAPEVVLDAARDLPPTSAWRLPIEFPDQAAKGAGDDRCPDDSAAPAGSAPSTSPEMRNINTRPSLSLSSRTRTSPPSDKSTKATSSESSASRFLTVISPPYTATSVFLMYSTYMCNVVYYGGMYAFPQVLVSMGDTLTISAGYSLLIACMWEAVGTLVAFFVGMYVPRKKAILIWLAAGFVSISMFALALPEGQMKHSGGGEPSMLARRLEPEVAGGGEQEERSEPIPLTFSGSGGREMFHLGHQARALDVGVGDAQRRSRREGTMQADEQAEEAEKKSKSINNGEENNSSGDDASTSQDTSEDRTPPSNATDNIVVRATRAGPALEVLEPLRVALDLSAEMSAPLFPGTESHTAASRGEREQEEHHQGGSAVKNEDEVEKEPQRDQGGSPSAVEDDSSWFESSWPWSRRSEEKRTGSWSFLETTARTARSPAPGARGRRSFVLADADDYSVVHPAGAGLQKVLVQQEDLDSSDAEPPPHYHLDDVRQQLDRLKRRREQLARDEKRAKTRSHERDHGRPRPSSSLSQLLRRTRQIFKRHPATHRPEHREGATIQERRRREGEEEQNVDVDSSTEPSSSSSSTSTTSKHSSRWFREVLLECGLNGQKFAVVLGFFTTYLYALESFPTRVRATGTAVALAAGRWGAITAPSLYEWVVKETGSPAAFFSMLLVFLGINLILLIVLPLHETAGKPLVDEDDDEEEQGGMVFH